MFFYIKDLWLPIMHKIIKYLLMFLLLCPSATQALAKAQIANNDGLNAWFYADKSLPIVLINIDFPQAGSAFEKHGGTAKLLEKMLGEGAGKYSATEFNEELDQYAIEFSANAGLDNFSIQMKTLRENLPRAMELLQLALTEPHFAKDDLQRIKNEQLSIITALNENPNHHLQRLFYKNAFKNHPYHNSPYGDKASIAAITAKDLRHFMFEHFRRDYVKISIAGDVDAGLIEQQILPYFAKLPAPRHLPHSLPKTQIATFTKLLHYEMNVPQSNVMLVHHGINRKNELFYAAYVLQHILGGGSLSSKLGQKLREENGLVYGVNASFVQTDASEWFVTNFATKNETAELAIKLANEVINKAANGEITETELQEAKQYLIGSFALATDSNADRLQYLSMMQRYDLGVDYLEKRNDLIAAVDLKQLQHAAKNLQGAPLMILSVGKQALISD